jgi:hypothetical protein
MKRETLWLLALAALLAYFPATYAQQGGKGPTPTVDAFPRTPVAVVNNPPDPEPVPYIVPSGYRFVIESIAVEFACDTVNNSIIAGRAIFDGGVYSQQGGVPDIPRMHLSLPLQGQSNSAYFTAVSDLRVVLEPDDALAPTFIGCVDSGNGLHAAQTRRWAVHGYLVSIDSPRLAP